MKKLLLFAVACLWAMSTYAQSRDFMPGYFIDEAGNRVDCFIRNEDKLTSPTQLEYKLSEAGEKQIATIQQVQYFEITNTTAVYERHTVQIDKSSSNLKELSGTREPEFIQETLFLRVIIKGKASLFHYKSKFTGDKFFQKTDERPIEQLIYKKYMGDDAITVLENNAFKQQLWATLSCGDSDLDTFEKVKYNETELRKAFIKYNECASADYVNYALFKGKGELNFGLRTGAGVATMQFNNIGRYGVFTSTSTGISPQVGFDMVYNLPFNRGKWGLFFQPTFQHYQGKTEIKAFGRDAVVDVTYQYISLPFGIRRTIYANENAKLHLNFAAVQHVLLNTKDPIDFDITLNAGFEHKHYDPSITFAFGAGYTLRDKYVVEATYQTHREMSSNGYWNIKFVNAFSLQVGYKLR